MVNFELVVGHVFGRNHGVADAQERTRNAAQGFDAVQIALCQPDGDGETQVVFASKKDIDVISFAKESDNFAFNILFVRDGMLLGQTNVSIKGPQDEQEALRRFLIDHYIKNMVPTTISIPFDISDDGVPDFLKSRYRGQEKFVLTSKVLKNIKGLRTIGLKNLEEYLKSASLKQNRSKDAMQFLSEALGVSRVLNSVECYDMSNISGKYSVGVKVVFEDGSSKKSLYRKYKIKGTFKGDDLKMMREVVKRRLNHLEDEPLSDVVFVDGGKTQLGAVFAEFNNSKIFPFLLLSIAKDKSLSKGLSADKIYYIDVDKIRELKLPVTLLNFFKMIRDETHRFAISYHRALRERGALKS